MSVIYPLFLNYYSGVISYSYHIFFLSIFSVLLNWKFFVANSVKYISPLIIYIFHEVYKNLHFHFKSAHYPIYIFFLLFNIWYFSRILLMIHIKPMFSLLFVFIRIYHSIVSHFSTYYYKDNSQNNCL